MTLSSDEAAEALLSIRGARKRASEMKRLPWSYHFAVGALMGSWVAIQGLPRWWFGMGVLAVVAATYALVSWQRNATGRWINGLRMGRTLWVAGLTIAVAVGFLVTSNPKMLPGLALFTPLQGGLATFCAVTFLDWLWVKIYDAELRGGR